MSITDYYVQSSQIHVLVIKREASQTGFSIMYNSNIQNARMLDEHKLLIEVDYPLDIDGI